MIDLVIGGSLLPASQLSSLVPVIVMYYAEILIGGSAD
jgi:hypothetical protein